MQKLSDKICGQYHEVLELCNNSGWNRTGNFVTGGKRTESETNRCGNGNAGG